MTDIIFGIDLITKTETIKKKIMKSLIAQLKIKIPALRPRIEGIVKGLIGKYIKFSPEYLSFGGGILQKELGVLDPYSSLDDMLSILVNTVTVKMRPVYQRGGQIGGGFTVTAVPTDFYNQVTTLGKYTSENGYEVPWLSWLLTAGDQVILKDYKISFGGNAKMFSRTGGPIMRRNEEGWGVGASSSRVPPQFSGTPSNNFVTRAMTTMAPELEKKLRILIRSKL